jgi:hypothetical protein
MKFYEDTRESKKVKIDFSLSKNEVGSTDNYGNPEQCEYSHIYI